MDLLSLRIASVVAISLVYMLFDVFNRRNVPSLFAYATLGYGFALTLLYFSATSILVALGVAFMVLGGGYFLYKAGQLGGADVIELAALSLVLPLQPAPFFMSGTNQFGLPFVVSLIINTGIVAIVLVPIYYLPKAKRALKKPLLSFVDNKGVFKALLLVVAYLAFVAFLKFETGITTTGMALLVLMVLASACIMLFEKPITGSMIEHVDASKFEEGDIIAFNLMDRKEIRDMKKHVKNFDRLVTDDIISEMKAKRMERKFPVYKKAMPFAVAIFAGVVLALLVGNLMLLILPLY